MTSRHVRAGARTIVLHSGLRRSPWSQNQRARSSTKRIRLFL